MSNTINTTDIYDDTTTEDTCLQERFWSYFLASSLIILFGGLILILTFRLIKYLTCYQAKQHRPRPEPSLDDSRHRNNGRPKIKVGCLTRMKWHCEALMSGQTFPGRILVSLSVILSMGSLIIYLLDASIPNVPSETCFPFKQSVSQIVDFAFNIFFMIAFFIRFIAADDKLSFWLEIPSFVDYFTIPPSFVGIALNRQWLGLRFLRALRFMSFPDILQYLSLLRTSNSIRLAQLSCIFLSVWLAAAGFVHLVETTGDPFSDFSNGQELTYWEAVYFIVVTMSTVGYGDIYCVTTIGRAFMVLFIFGALAMFASFIPEMADILGTRQRYGGMYEKPSGVRHIVICGHITYESVHNFLKDFLHEDRENTNIKCLFLDNKRPDLELEALFKRHFTHVVFFKGTIMSTRDLNRVKLQDADACLVLANPRSRDPDAQDAASIMRVIAAKNYCQDIRVVIQLLRYNNKAFCMNLPSWEPSTDQVICLAEMKLGFMAQGCLAPGFSTLLANLFIMRSYKKSAKCLQWQDSYLRGAGMEVYTGYFSTAFYGKTFPQVAHILFTKLKILVVAVALNGGATDRVVLNPGNDVIIDDDTKGFFICQSEDEAKRVRFYCVNCHEHITNPYQIKQCRCFSNKNSHTPSSNIEEANIEESPVFLPSVDSKMGFNHNGTADDLNMQVHADDIVSHSTERAETTDSGHSSSSETLPMYSEIMSPNTSGDDEDIKLDTTGLFHWCPARTIKESILSPGQNRDISARLRNHVILCLFAEKGDPVIGLCNFVMPLRSSTIKSTDMKPIVIIGSEEYIKKEWDLLANFPKVYIKLGSSLNRMDLRSVRVNRCSMCVILTTNDTSTDDITLIDKEAILCSLNIKTMFFQAMPNENYLSLLTDSEQHKELLKSRGSTTSGVVSASGASVPMLTELANDYNAQFLDQDDEDDPDIPLYMTQPFACGRAFAASVLDTLMSTTFFNAESLSLIRTLITGGSTSDLEQLLAEGLGFVEGKHSPAELQSCRSRCRVSLLPLDRGILASYNTGTYEELFVGALQQFGILCIGLYRVVCPRPALSSTINRYIVTNPAAETAINESDQVYCLEPFHLHQSPTGSPLHQVVLQGSESKDDPDETKL